MQTLKAFSTACLGVFVAVFPFLAFAGLMMPDFPDAVAYNCDVYDGEAQIGTTTVAWVFSNVDDIYAPLEGDPFMRIVYGGTLSFDMVTRETVDDLCDVTVIPAGTSIDDTDYFQQYVFGTTTFVTSTTSEAILSNSYWGTVIAMIAIAGMFLLGTMSYGNKR